MLTPTDLQSVVDQTVWRQPARSQAKADLEFFLPYAMAYATDEALSKIRRHVDDNQLRSALRAAPIGLFEMPSSLAADFRLIRAIFFTPCRCYRAGNFGQWISTPCA
jgi:hypothetical protein